MNKGHQARSLLIGKVEVWHALFRASTSNDSTDLVSVRIFGYQLGVPEIRSTGSSARVSPVTERAILLKESVSCLDQSHGVRFLFGRDSLFRLLRSLCSAFEKL